MNTPHHRIPLIAVFLTLTTYLGFSTFDALGRLLMLRESLPQAQVMTLVMGLGLIPVLLMVHLRGEWGQLKPKAPVQVLGRAALACVEVWLVFQAFKRLQLAEAYALFFTVPLWVLLFSTIFLKEKIGKRQKIALLIGFVGAIIATHPSIQGLSLGQLAGLGAAFCGGCGMIMMRHLGKTESNGTILLAFFIGQVIFNAAMMQGWHMPSSAAWTLIVIAGLAEGIAHVCLLLALQRVPAPLVAPFQYSQILWALLFGVLLFGELPTTYTMTGLVFITIAGLVLLQRRQI